MYGSIFHFNKKGFSFIVVSLQALGTETFVKASLAAAHARRRTVKETDVQLVEQLKHMPRQSCLSA